MAVVDELEKPGEERHFAVGYRLRVPRPEVRRQDAAAAPDGRRRLRSAAAP